MAKAKYSALLSDLRGKLNGSVASKNRGGAYLRNKVTPVNPRSASQMLVRARFGNFSSQWRTLTQAQQNAWNAAVAAYAKTDIFGDLRNPTGLQLFQRVNSKLIASGGTAITSPAANKGVSSVTITSLSYTSGTPALSLIRSGAIPANTRMQVFATAPLSGGINFVKSQLRQISTVAAAVISPDNLLVAYNAKFGAVGAIGTKIFVGVVFIDQLSGVSSPMQIISTIAIA